MYVIKSDTAAIQEVIVIGRVRQQYSSSNSSRLFCVITVLIKKYFLNANNLPFIELALYHVTYSFSYLIINVFHVIRYCIVLVSRVFPQNFTAIARSNACGYYISISLFSFPVKCEEVCVRRQLRGLRKILDNRVILF